MKFLEKIKIFNKKSKIRKDLDNLISNLPESNIIAKDLLKYLSNNTTKCTFDKDIKGCYYVYLNDTIYLSNNQTSKNNYERLCVIAHECIHSVQPKILQFFNFILSNLEVISFILFFILYFLKVNILYIFLGYISLASLSIVFRLILEIWALNKAPKLSKKYLESNNLSKENVENVYNLYNFSTRLLMPLAIFGFFPYRIIRIIVVVIIFVLNI